MTEPVLVLMPLFLMVYFSSVLRLSTASDFVFQFVCLVMPMISNVTLTAKYSYVTSCTISGLLIVHSLSFSPSNVSYLSVLSTCPGPKPSWVTSFRACTNLMTVVCILAVDLTIFPRRFAKTEDYGFGLMDLGVGFFAVCNGLVHSDKRNIVKEIKTVVVLLAIGLSRILLVSLLGYYEHVTEYGTHWNFFITLALCRLMTIIMRYLRLTNFFLLAIGFMCCHELMLSMGAEEWILGGSPRETFISANREGIFSIPGYLTIYYASAAYTKFMCRKKLLSLMACTTLMTIISAVITVSCRATVSRRLCNLGYISWTLSMAGCCILILNGVNLARKQCNMPVPGLLNLINKHSLIFFLLGNILTGLSNFAFQTILLSPFPSYVLLICYVLSVSSIVYVYDRTKEYSAQLNKT